MPIAHASCLFQTAVGSYNRSPAQNDQNDPAYSVYLRHDHLTGHYTHRARSRVAKAPEYMAKYFLLKATPTSQPDKPSPNLGASVLPLPTRPCFRPFPGPSRVLSTPLILLLSLIPPLPLSLSLITHSTCARFCLHLQPISLTLP